VKIKECVHTWANSTGYIHILNAGKLAPRVANWLGWYPFFQPWGQYKAIKFSIH